MESDVYVTAEHAVWQSCEPGWTCLGSGLVLSLPASATAVLHIHPFRLVCKSLTCCLFSQFGASFWCWASGGRNSSLPSVAQEEGWEVLP